MGSHGAAYFLIMGNGRTGSTWLSTSLDQIPDIFCARELKWGKTDYELKPVHYEINLNSGSAIDVLREIYGSELNRQAPTPVHANAVGSKFILDPYYYCPDDFFRNFAGFLQDLNLIVLLHRNFLASFLSWKTRGVYHKLGASQKDNKVDFYLRHGMQEQAEPETRSVCLTKNGHALEDFAYDASKPSVTCDSLTCEIDDCIDDLFQAFHNDLQLLGIVRASKKGLLLDYDDLPDRIPEIVDALGSKATKQQIQHVVDNPPTQQLARLERRLIQPEGVIDRLADVLETAFHDVAVARTPVDAIWRWSEDYSEAHIDIPRLKRCLDSMPGNAPGTLLERLRSRFGSATVIWKPRKPVLQLQW
jgi:hypothetical protein